MNAPLAEMLRYKRWATLTLLEACRVLTDDQLDARAAGASGATRELLVHLVGGQQTLALRTKGRQHEGELGRHSPWPGFDELARLATDSADALVAIAEGLDSETEVDLPFQGKTYRFPLSFFLVHAVEHGAEHRTEIKVALNQAGVATPDLDGWSFAAAMGYGQEVT
ncbi:MAG: DinB family protein [Dehalococcoidia bacterium]